MGVTHQHFPVVLYHYDASPMARKVRNILALKKIQYHGVDMPMTLPRPDLADRLGVKYRRIPVLAIGKDVYCDTSLIASALERRFPPSAGFGTLFPRRKGTTTADTGMIKAFSVSYADKVLMELGSQSLPYHKFKPDFLEDRSAWFGRKVDPEAMLANQPVAKSWLASHLALIEEQLSDGREWLMDTESPSLADVSVHAVFEWIIEFRPLRHLQELFDPTVVPASSAWITRMSQHIVRNRTIEKVILDDMTGARAAEYITSSEAEDLIVVGFDETDASRLGLRRGDIVLVTPTDNGKVPTSGVLISLNKEEVVVEARGSDGVVHCHFPRLNYTVQKGGAEAKL